jgi:hypothetical protein
LAIVVTSIIVVVDEGDAVASVLPGPAVSYTTSWDSTALREVLFQKRDFKAALGQGLEAMKLAPKDGDIHFEVAKLYFAALTNESRIRRGATNDTPDELRGCTLHELGCSIDDAGQAVWQNSEAAVMSPTTEPSNQEAAQFMMDRLVGKGP